MGEQQKTPVSKKPAKKVRFSIRIIATLASAVLVALTAVVLFGINEKYMRTTLQQEAQTQLVLDARNLALSSTDAMLSDFPELTLVPLAKDLLNERPEILSVVIVNHEGNILGSPDSRQIGRPWSNPSELVPLPSDKLLEGETLLHSSSLILVKSPVHYFQESDLGWVILTLDKGFIQAKVAAYRARVLSIAGILMVSAMILAAIFMSILFRPITKLREGLERIGQGDLDSPMNIRDATELGMLAETVNEMADQLKTSRNLAQAREQEVIDTQKEVIVTLGEVVESRSSETANHTIRVGAMSYELAVLAGLSRAEAELVKAASPMHDVGKIGIPDSILNKPGKLTDAEFTTMKLHPQIGYSILNKSERPILKAAAIIAHEHHERWDGKGYPQGKSGENIHIYGRIVGLVDVFDALFSNRVYRKAMPLDRVLAIIEEGRGTHFEARLVDLFLGKLPRFLAIAEQFFDEEVLNLFKAWWKHTTTSLKRATGPEALALVLPWCPHHGRPRPSFPCGISGGLPR